MSDTTAGAVDRKVQTSTERDALLYDFGVDSAKLGIEHTKYLDELIKFLNDPTTGPMVVSLDGLASHTGGAQHNVVLSEQREQAVESYLRARTKVFEPGQPHKINRNFKGFSSSPPGENPWFRAVRIVIHRPGVVPPPIPPPSGLSEVTVWINAFINKDVKDGSGGLLTFKLSKGPGLGKSVIPGPIPLFPDCYMTDNRDFDDSITAEARIHAEITLDFTGSSPAVSSKRPKLLKCSPSQRFRISDGALLNTATGVVKGDLVPDATTMTAGSRRVAITVNLAASNPVARTPMLIPIPFPPFLAPNPIPTSFDPPPPIDPDIDVEGTIIVDAAAKTVEFTGKLDRFPFFEMYASTDGGATAKMLFRIPPTPGDTPANLFGKANRDVTGILGKPAKITF